MDSIIAILAAFKDTPIPTILVVAGILFLLLAIAGQLAGKIAVPPERQRQAMIMGGLLLAVGIALHLAPPRLPSTPTPPGPPPGQTAAVSPVDIGGTWYGERDVVYAFDQHGKDVAFTAKNPQTGLDASGRGTIDGRQLTITTYQTNRPSTGRATGEVSEGARQMTLTVEDSLLGRSTLVLSRERPPDQRSLIDNWLWGDYSAALADFARNAHESADPAEQDLARKRLRWLEPYRRRIIFADDLENDTTESGVRWWIHPPGSGTGTGSFTRVRENGNGNYVLEGREHYHADAQIQNGRVSRDFEVQLRFRPVRAQAGGAHINIMMDATQGRTTIGIYATEKRISVWESMHGQQPHPEISRDRAQSFDARWYPLRAVIEGARVQVFLDGKSVITYTSPRPEVFLQRFNLETVEGVMQFDDVLVVFPR